MGRVSQSLTHLGARPREANDVLFAAQIRLLREDRRKFLMTLSDGDINEYQLLKSLSLVDFIAKFSKFTATITAKQKIAQEQKKRAKRGR